MLSATPMAVVADVPTVDCDDSAENTTAQNDASQTDANDPSQITTSVVFVDGSIDDYQALIDDIRQSGDDSTVVLLDSTSDGIDQITDYLSRQSGIESVHIVSHGNDGEVQLGSTVLNSETIERYAGRIASWSNGLSSSADILFYGCDLAATEDGEHLVEALSELTGADVVASDDITGNSDLGGDWDLEFAVGQIDTDVVFSATIQEAWMGTLETITVDTLEDVVDANDGVTSLREAVIAANSTFNEPDIIELGSGVHTLNLSGSGDASLGDLDINSVIEIIGAADGSTVIDANELNDRVFDVSGQETTLRNLTIQGGQTSETFGGGGILAAGGSTLNLDSVIFFDNTAVFGGGLRSNGTTSIVDTTFIGNHATEDGGALAITSGTATVLNSTASGNSAENRGGAVYVSSVAGQTTHQFINLTLSGNSALQGGGLFSNGGTTNVEHATITDNAATDTGGGIQRNSGDLQISNSIIAGNRALAGSIEIAGNIDSGGKNIIGDNPGDSNGGGGYNNDLLNQTGLKLGDLADNGVQVQTHELLEDSVGIDGTGISSIGQTDARGYLVADSVRDTGAFERGATPPPSEQAATVSSIWVSSLTSFSDSNAPGLSEFDDVDVLKIGDPNLVLESGDGTNGASNGTFSKAVDFDSFTGFNADTDAIHYVQNSITVGGVALNPGDVLFSGTQNLSYTSENSVQVNPGDVYVFQPSTAGDYSSGTFTQVIDVSVVSLPSIAGFSLVEADVAIGDASLRRGDFVILDSTNQIHHYDLIAGELNVLVDGNDLGIDGEVAGVHLVTAETTIGGQVIDAGRLIVSLDMDDASTFDNNISVAQSDVVVLNVMRTGAGTTEANGSILFDGSDVGLSGEDWDALTIASEPQIALANDAPTTDLSSGIEINTDGGNDTYLIANDGGGILGGATALTFETTFSGSPSGSATPLISYAAGDATGDDFYVAILANGDLSIVIGDSIETASTINYNDALLDGEKHSLAVSWDSTHGGWSVFVDGQLTDSEVGAIGSMLAGTTNDGEIVFGNDQDTIGGSFDANESFQGTFYDVRIWDRFLEAPEIQQYQNQKLDAADLPSGLIANWQFDEINGSNEIVDVVSQTNNLSVAHVMETGYIASTPIVDLNIDEHTTNGTQVGYVIPTGGDNTPTVDSILASDPTLSYDETTGKFYKAIEGDFTWIDANSGATSTEINGVTGQLVTIRSQHENDLVQGLASSLTTPEDVWIGASDQNTEGDWHWYVDGVQDDADLFYVGDDLTGSPQGDAYTNWQNSGGINEPNADTIGEDYARLNESTGEWRDTDISVATYSYVIEWDASEVLSNSSGYTFTLADDASGRFAIDSNTGEITVADASQFNFETNASHDVNVEVTDASGVTYDEGMTIIVNDVNDRPTAIGGTGLTLDSVNQNDTSPAGTSVADLLASGLLDPIGDADAGAVDGIAIFSAEGTNGTWEYSVDGSDGSWNSLVTASPSSAVLLDTTGFIRFVPNPGYSGSGDTIVFNAWDQTDGRSSGDTGVNVTAENGPTSAFSSGPLTATVDVIEANEAPSFDGTLDGNPTFVEDSGGVQIDADVEIFDAELSAIDDFGGSSLTLERVGGANSEDFFQRDDSSDLEFTGANFSLSSVNKGTYTQSGGTIVFNFDAGVTNAEVNEVMQSLAYLNRSDNPPASVDVQWTFNDGNSGGQGSGGAGEATGTTTVDITPVNDAPVVDATTPNPNFAEITEDNLNNDGNTVSFLLTQLVDPDTGENLVTDVDGDDIGIAIVVNNGNGGTWQYSTDAGATWLDVGAVSDANALLLQETDLLRLNPDEQQGTNANLGFRAWDQSDALEAGTFADLRPTGTDSAFSLRTLSAQITVSDVNDAPVVVETGFLLTDISESDQDPAGDTVASLLASLSGDGITDVDVNPVEGIAVTGVDNTNGVWQYSTNDGTTWLSFGSVSSGNSTLLDTDALVRFVPNADYSGTSGNFSFRGWDQTNGLTSGDTGVNLVGELGGTGAYSSSLAVARLQVTSFNSAPTIDLDADDSAGTNGINFNTSFESGGPAIRLTDGAVVGDVDGTIQTLTIRISNIQDGSAERLTFFLPDGLNSNYVASSGFLRFTAGPSATNADFQQVLNSIFYQNTLPTPDLTTREITFVVNDGELDSSVATTFVSFGMDTGDAAAPVEVNNSSDVVDEGTTLLIASDQLQYSDQQATSSINYSVTLAPNNGFLALSTNATTPISSFTQEDIDLDKLIYVHDGSETTSDQFLFTVDDGLGNTDSGQFDIVVNAVNDAPVLDNAGQNTLTAIDEDNFNSSGDTVASIIASAGNPDAITDADVDAVEGIAIYAADSTNGTWEYLSNDGITWTGFGTPSATAALLLTEETLVRFVPDADFNGDATFSYQAWDQTTGDQGDSISLSNNTGGTGSLSDGLDTARITVNSVNDAPELTGGMVSNLTVNEDSGFTSLGLAGLTHSAGGGVDENSQALTYEVTVVPSLASGSVYLADQTTVVTTGTYTLAEIQGMVFRPAAEESGTTFFEFQVVDDGGTANGGEDTLSHSIQITVNGVNDAPTIDLDADDSASTSGVDYNTSFATGGGAVLLTDGAVLDDIDGTIQSLTISITNIKDGALERLSHTRNGNIGSIYTAETGSLTLIAGDSATNADFEQVLNSVTYENTSLTPDTTRREITFVANDGEIDSSVATAFVSLSGDAIAPVLINNSGGVVNEGETLTITSGELQFFDTQGAASITYSVTSDPANGFLALSSAATIPVSIFTQEDIDLGNLIYVHSGSETTSDQFVFTVDDGQGNSDSGQFDIVVNAVNDDPTAIGESISINEDATFVSDSTSNLLLNDSDADGDPLTVNATPIVGPSNGTLVLNEDGSYTYTPNADFNGTDSFTYEITDGTATATAAVDINIAPVNDTPTASGPASLSAGEQRTLRLNGTGFTLGDIDSGDSDIQVVFSVTEGIVFTSFGDSGVSVSNDDATTTITGTVTEITNLLSGSSTGFVAYQNNSDSPSPTATLTMRVNDLGNTGADPGLTGDDFSEVATTTTTINIAPVNDAPNLTLSGISVDEGSANNTLTNEDLIGTDVDDAPADLTYRLLSIPSEGLLGFNNGGIPVVLGLFDTFTQADVDSGNIFYTHSGSEAPTDSFDLEFYDGGEDSAATQSGTFEIAVNKVNDAPTAIDDDFTVAEDGTLSATLGVDDLLQNDSDPDGDTLTVNTTPVSGPANGSLTLGTDGTFTYTPNADFNGTDSFTYAISDTNGVTAEATVNINVTSVNDAPVLQNDTVVSIDENTTSVGTFVGVDPEGATLTYFLTGTDADLFSIDGQTGEVSFISAPDSENPLDSNGDNNYEITVVASDDQGLPESQNVSVVVTNVNEAPVASDLNFTSSEDEALVGQLNVSDPEGDPLTVILDPANGPANGTVDVNSDGSFTYTPDANFFGNDSFAYIVTDPSGANATGTVNIDINSVNDVPTTTPVTLTPIAEDSATIIITQADLLTNADDADFDLLTADDLAIVSGNGLLINNGDGTWNYTPAANDDSEVSFSYTVSDENETVAATATIDITPVNDAPVLPEDATVTIDEGSDFAQTFTGTDVDDDTLTYSLTGPDADIFNIDAVTGEVTFASTPDFENPVDANGDNVYEITVVATDDGTNSLSDSQNFDIVVSDVNEFSVGPARDIDNTINAVDENSALGTTVGIIANAVDADAINNVVTYSLQDDDGGRFAIDSVTGEVTVAGDIDFETDGATRDIVIRAESADGSFSDQTFTLTINDVNEAPTVSISGVVFSIPESTDTTDGIRIADILVSDDALGNNQLSLSGANAGVFEIVGNELRLRAGTVLDFDSLSEYDVNIEVNDTAIGDAVDDAVSHTLNVLDSDVVLVSNNDAYEVNQLESVEISANGVLSNDIDVSGQELMATLVSAPSNGQVVLNSDGTFVYTPNENFSGTDSFTYQAFTAFAVGNVATVEITVLDTGISAGPGGIDNPSDSQNSDDNQMESPDNGETISNEMNTINSETTPTSQIVETIAEDTASNITAVADNFVDRRNGTQSNDSINSESEEILVALETVIDDVNLSNSESADSRDRIEMRIHQVARDFGARDIAGFQLLNLSDSNLFPAHSAGAGDSADQNLKEIVSGTYVITTATFSVGYVLWLIRGGSLLASFSSALPLWASLDPLAMVAASEDDRTDAEDNESLVEITNSISE